MTIIVRHKALWSALIIGVLGACTSNNRSEGSGPSLLPDGGVDSAPAESCEGRRCSRDLHQVVDGCGDHVLETCGENLGCREGACVPACDSAAAAEGSIGCSFWTTAPDVRYDDEADCYAAFIANTWDTPVSVTAEFGSEPLDISESIYRGTRNGGGPVTYERIDGPIPPGEVGIVFLSVSDQTPDTQYYVGCPRDVKVAYHGLVTPDHWTSRSKAFHLSTSVPVSAYAIYPYGGAASFVPAATLLYPSTSWRTSYMLVDPWRYQYRVGFGYPYVQIVAEEDTEIRLRPGVDVVDGVDVPGGPRGSVLTWNLKRGEVLKFTQIDSLGGSPLEATKPVAVFGGHQCAGLLDGQYTCDLLYQQIAPVEQWSNSYSGVPYRSRLRSIAGTELPAERVHWQLVAANNDTVLTWSPAAPPGTPDTMSAGQRAYFETDKVFSVKSQDKNHPIYLAVYMTSAGTYGTTGDPDYVNIVPDDQFLDHYVFFIDYTYDNSTLTFVRRKDDAGFHDVTLDCLGKVTDWKPLGTDGTIEYAWVEMTNGALDVPTPLGTCSHGLHEASSDGPFALYVWGTDDYASYGFPAGAGSRPTSPYRIEVH